MSKFIKRKKKVLGMPAYIQLSAIRQDFPNLKVVKKNWNSFEVKIKLQPTPLSEVYDVLIAYKKNTFVKVYIIEKVLKIAPNRKKLPHIYNSKNQQICLYSPSKKEWKSTKLISKTIVPWASEWLYYYELWLQEGIWYGGGHDEYPDETSERILKNE